MQYFQKLIQKDLGFGYNLAEPIASYDRAELWSLHAGTSKATSDPALVFHFDPTKPRNGTQSRASLAKQGLLRLKTLRHPDILKYVSSVEGTDGTIYIATEQATPLATVLQKGSLDRETVQWGLFTISRALGFLHDSGLIHARLNPSAVFVTPTGDWKLGGLECVTPHAQASSLGTFATSLQSDAYQSPEFARGNWAGIASGAASAVDSWALGCLIYEAHSGSLTSPEQLQNVSVMPKQLLSAYQKLLASNVGARAPAGQLPNHPYFQNSKFVELNMFVENLALKGQLEREAFLGKLPNIMDRLPDGFCTFKILPMLSQSMVSGTGGNAAFACIIKMKDRLSETQFAKHVVNKYAAEWYGNQNIDRNLKVELYNKLDLFVQHFDSNVLNGTVFSAMSAAFQDMQAPALRDSAVKAVLTISQHLTDKNLNSSLMSHFARLQVDPEPAIRTNTTVCLGKLAVRLSQAAKNKVLAAAFLRSLKDPFPPARSAGLNAILITSEYYSVKDIAARLLPAIVPLLIDGSGEVRRLSFQVLDTFKGKLSANHEHMTRTEEMAAANGEQNGGTMDNKSSVTSASGWGLSSLSSIGSALLSTKSDAAKSGSTSTGISSADFVNKQSPPKPKQSAYSSSNGPSNTTSISSDIWGGANGSEPRSQPPAAFSSAPLQSNSGPVQSSSFSDMGAFGGDGGFDDDADADGWGDMDIKTNKPVDEEDIFVSMMGQPPSRPKTIPGGLAKSGNGSASGNKPSSSGGGDLWDLAPPLVTKPKPRPKPATGLGSSRRGKKTGGDDWEALLGGTGSSRRKPAGRR